MKAVTSFLTPEKNYLYWFKKNWYYHAYCKALYRLLIPPGRRILHVNCKAGFLFDAMKASYGVGIDSDPALINSAQNSYPGYQFFSLDLENLSPETFDYIILSSFTMEVDDVQNLFKTLRPFCHEKTRIILDTYNALWEPFLWMAQKIGLKRPANLKNWLNFRDIKNFLYLENYEVITQSRYLLFPLYIPLISWFFNNILAYLPLVNSLCLLEIIVAKPIAPPQNKNALHVSVIVPCKNERGNIVNAVERCPVMGASTEIIFVEGGSKDGTKEEIERIIKNYKKTDKKIVCMTQTGKGKGDAVRLGFSHATGDILMILDADLTVEPEELPKFFNALVEGKGDFINGSRLVYGMENNAMRFLNLCANYLFGIGFTWLLGQPIKDTLCGTKVIFKKDYEDIEKNRSFFGEFDPFGDFDLLFGAAKLQLKIIEMPVHYKNRTYGHTQISRFKHGILLLHMSWIAFKKFKNFRVRK